MSGETEIVQAILSRLDALAVALDEDLEALEPVPSSVAELAALSTSRRIASRALLKTVEQLEDQLARLFRVIPNALLIDTSRWYAQDYANFAEKVGILEDGFAWTKIIKLRNKLVHDYPLDREAQVALLNEAYRATGSLRAAVLAARRFINGGGLDG